MDDLATWRLTMACVSTEELERHQAELKGQVRALMAKLAAVSAEIAMRRMAARAAARREA